MLFSESMPGCVPEYYRSMLEAEEHELELQAEAQERFRANRQKLDAAKASGLPILPYGGYDACRMCPHADHDTATFEEDDFDGVVCHDPSCSLHREHRTKEESE